MGLCSCHCDTFQTIGLLHPDCTVEHLTILTEGFVVIMTIYADLKEVQGRKLAEVSGWVQARQSNF